MGAQMNFSFPSSLTFVAIVFMGTVLTLRRRRQLLKAGYRLDTPLVLLWTSGGICLSLTCGIFISIWIVNRRMDPRLQAGITLHGFICFFLLYGLLWLSVHFGRK